MTAAVVKWDKTSGLDRNHNQTWSHLQLTLIRKGSIKYCLLLLWARLKIYCISRIWRVWNIVCVHVCKTTNWRFIIMCSCIYIVVINCGWNNNVAVKIVACWHWNIYTSSWLDRHGEFVSTLHVRCESLNRRECCQIVYSLSKSVCGSANLVSSVKVNLFR